MKASDTMKAVKQWFKLSNYDVLQEITVNDLSYEISRRVSLHRHDFTKEEHSGMNAIWERKPRFWLVILFSEFDRKNRPYH